MLFNKKNKICNNCNKKINSKFSYCPYCGASADPLEKTNNDDYGFLGKDNLEEPKIGNYGFGITDRLMNSLVNSLIKTLDKQFKQIDKEFEMAEVKSFPNGIKIKIGPRPLPEKKQKYQRDLFSKKITEKQIEKISTLPRVEAKTNIKRIGDKIVYELDAPGIQSPNDIFISKLESGYEIKAIGNKKVYVNNLHLNLPLQKLSFANNKLFIEFEANQ